MEPKIWFMGFNRSYRQPIVILIAEWRQVTVAHYMSVELGAFSIDQHHGQL